MLLCVEPVDHPVLCVRTGFAVAPYLIVEVTENRFVGPQKSASVWSFGQKATWAVDAMLWQL